MIYPDNSSRDNFYTYSAILVDKADNIRLQYVNISFNLPDEVIRKWHCQSVQVYLNISNPGIIWRANKDGLDPDYNTIPPFKNIAAGLRCNF
jgi:hypothetical protein